jgi:hypothetical protein
MRTTLHSQPVSTSLDLVDCPECQALARVEWRDTVESTDGPVEIAKVRCLDGHWFLMPSQTLQGR